LRRIDVLPPKRYVWEGEEGPAEAEDLPPPATDANEPPQP